MSFASQAAAASRGVLLTPGTAAARPPAPVANGPFPDYKFAPNIGGHPQSYELENRAVEQAGHVLPAMRALAPWAGKTIVDLGCGTGFWLPKYADAGHVIGIEPNPALRRVAAASARAAVGRRAEVLAGSAEHIPLQDGSADVVHARFAYFFPPGAEAGLTEVLRVLRPGGCLVVVDNDYRWGEFASLLASSSARPPLQTAAVVDAWWRDRRARRHEVRSELRFANRADLAAVLRIEVPGSVADGWLRRNPAALSLTYGFVLFAVQANLTRTG